MSADIEMLAKLHESGGMVAYTEKPPASPGLYWFKHYDGDKEPGVLLLDADGVGWLHGDDAGWKGGGPAGTLFGPMVAHLK